ncbi:hypothetical protein EV363DRAFT_676844 [Boletus edulis]|uniref:Uncharacterized protein n=1 Tax=Boletus edulis BED1 TaxID=1328754 RepID=A0AAD4G964_BOLED|nr:hypothetical protein EV363DRAFT_676844 [Boletus edulis]KAF8430841.1 hypothetical protein L210DRAFT_3017848 [Boletus edulis BED1]
MFAVLHQYAAGVELVLLCVVTPFPQFLELQPSLCLAFAPDAIFTTAVGPSTKRTLAGWHVTTPEEVVDHMLHLVGESSRGVTSTSGPVSDDVGGEAAKSYM